MSAAPVLPNDILQVSIPLAIDDLKTFRSYILVIRVSKATIKLFKGKFRIFRITYMTLGNKEWGRRKHQVEGYVCLNGLYHGLVREYKCLNRDLIKEYTCIDGVMNGLCVKYLQYGAMIFTQSINYKDGKKDGVMIIVHEGKPVIRSIYAMGALVEAFKILVPGESRRFYHKIWALVTISNILESCTMS
jgi:hypothetical protein